MELNKKIYKSVYYNTVALNNKLSWTMEWKTRTIILDEVEKMTSGL